jgi:hypothetical protein
MNCASTQTPLPCARFKHASAPPACPPPAGNGASSATSIGARNTRPGPLRPKHVSPIIDRMILRATNFEAQIGRMNPGSGELKTVIYHGTAELGSVTLKRIGCTQTFVTVFQLKHSTHTAAPCGVDSCLDSEPRLTSKSLGLRLGPSDTSHTISPSPAFTSAWWSSRLVTCSHKPRLTSYWHKCCIVHIPPLISVEECVH